jgi:hypothetical protein
MKLVSKTRHGASTHRVYDTAQTPYQRVLKSGILTKTTDAQLASTYAHLNPVRLLKQINDNVEHLWQLRERHPGEKIIKQGENQGNRNYDATRSSSVTVTFDAIRITKLTFSP